MNKYKICCAIISTLIILLFCSTSFSYEDSAYGMNQSALRGVKSVRVTTNEFDKYNISTYQLKNDVTNMLINSGIKIDNNADAELHIEVVVMNLDNSPQPQILGLYGTVKIFLEQYVVLLHNPRIQIRTRTWQSLIYYLHGPPHDFVVRVRNNVRDCTTSFINAYWIVNR